MKKIFLFKLITFCLLTNVFSQINFQHGIAIEFSSPSQIYNYPDKSQLYRLGYQPRVKFKKFDFGLTFLAEYNNFNILLPPQPGSTIDEINLRGFGARTGFFIGKKITQFISLDFYYEYGEHSNNIYIVENGIEVPNISAMRSHSLGFDAKYKWLDNWYFGIKVSYESYNLSQKTIFQTDQNFGHLIFKGLDLNKSLINGIIPTLSLQYRIEK